MTTTSTSSATRFAALVQGFFCQRLIDQQNVSQQTVAAYRDTFRLLLSFLQGTRNIAAASLTLADLDAETMVAFLDHLESQRHNSIRTRNARFAAIRSFLKYAAARDPDTIEGKVPGVVDSRTIFPGDVAAIDQQVGDAYHIARVDGKYSHQFRVRFGKRHGNRQTVGGPLDLDV